MNLMLAGIVAFVTVGLLARRIGTREQALVVLIAITMTALYYFGSRFM